MARAGATVADACGDGSSIYFNPANLSDNEGLTITVGGTLVDAFGDYTSGITGRVSDLQNDPILVPHFYASYQVNDNLTAGLGAYVPYGLSTEWNRSFEGAFEGYNNGVEAIYIQPTVSYRVSESFSLGGGPIVAISSVELNQVVDLSAQSLPGTETPFAAVGIPHHTAFADVTLEGHNAIGFGANVGATYNLNDRFAIAGRFTTPIKVTYDGDATFSQIQTGLRTRAPLGPFSAGSSLDDILALQFDEGLNPGATLVDQGVETEITFPAQLVFGVSYDATDRLLLLADYQWTSWSDLGVIPLNFDKDALDDERELNYGNTNAFRLGAEYQVLDNLTARAGYLYNTAAAPDETVTPLLPEANRNHVTIGATYRPVDVLEVSLAYQRLMQGDRQGRVRDVRPGEDVESLTALNEGLYAFNANLFGLTLTLHL